ncbi:MAG: DUF4276 family protein [Chloroflexi bacterium]|nr:DUF4276 family protein [Chloroflexota bacterium]
MYLYVEGGGDSKEQHARCREGFRKLLEKAGFAERMPRIVAGGGRGATFDKLQTALRANLANRANLLLVDSEAPVMQTPWAHLRAKDGWSRPPNATDDQAQFMVTCMETWLMADRAALREFFGPALNANALLPLSNLEQRPRQDVQRALEDATRPCGRDRQYMKGRRSYQALAALDPATLRQYLPYFVRLVETLNRYVQ